MTERAGMAPRYGAQDLDLELAFRPVATTHRHGPGRHESVYGPGRHESVYGPILHRRGSSANRRTACLIALLTLGHRRIAFINGPHTRCWSRARWEGVRRVVSEAGLGVLPTHVVNRR